MSERALVLHKAETFQVPALIAEVGPEAAKRFFEFFTVPIRNQNTRIAYYHAIGFWIGAGALGLTTLRISSRSQ